MSLTSARGTTLVNLPSDKTTVSTNPSQNYKFYEDMMVIDDSNEASLRELGFSGTTLSPIDHDHVKNLDRNVKDKRIDSDEYYPDANEKTNALEKNLNSDELYPDAVEKKIVLKKNLNSDEYYPDANEKDIILEKNLNSDEYYNGPNKKDIGLKNNLNSEEHYNDATVDDVDPSSKLVSSDSNKKLNSSDGFDYASDVSIKNNENKINPEDYYGEDELDSEGDQKDLTGDNLSPHDNFVTAHGEIKNAENKPNSSVYFDDTVGYLDPEDTSIYPDYDHDKNGERDKAEDNLNLKEYYNDETVKDLDLKDKDNSSVGIDYANNVGINQDEKKEGDVSTKENNF